VTDEKATEMQDPFHVGVFECGCLPESYERAHGTFADWFERYLGEPLAPVRFSRYRADLGELPKSADECDAYVVSGSDSSANDPDPWIADLGDFLSAAAESHPILGVCFGHQLLHAVHGGVVQPSEDGHGVGVHDYEVREFLEWMPEDLLTLSLMTNHGEQVVTPAPGSAVVAGSAFCPVAVSVIGPNVLTVQAHPEFTRSLALDLYTDRREQIGEARATAAIESLSNDVHDDHFAEVVRAFFKDR